MRLSLISLLFVLSVSARLQAQQTRMTEASVRGTERAVVEATYRHSRTAAKAALEKRLSGYGISRSRKAGKFRVYREVKLPAVMQETVDLYVRVAGSKKKPKITMAIARGYDNFLTDAANHRDLEQLDFFLRDLDKDMVIYEHDQDVLAKRKAADKANEALESSRAKAREARQ